MLHPVYFTWFSLSLSLSLVKYWALTEACSDLFKRWSQSVPWMLLKQSDRWSNIKTMYTWSGTSLWFSVCVWRVNQCSCIVRSSHLKQKSTSLNIDRTNKLSLDMKIFAHFLCFQANLLLWFGSPLMFQQSFVLTVLHLIVVCYCLNYLVFSWYIAIFSFCLHAAMPICVSIYNLSPSV